MERFDQRLDEGRLRYGFGAREATWDNDGVIFSLGRITTSRGQAALVTCRRRKKDTYDTGHAELRLRYIRDNADATPALSDSWPSSVVAGRRDECGCAFHPSADQSIIHDGASGRK